MRQHIWMRKQTTLVLAVAMTSALFAAHGLAQDYSFETPVRLKADGEVINTGKHIAHSGPALADMNDDGVTDLLVGNFAGMIEYFENIGSNEEPEYAAGKFLEAAGKPIKIHNW